MVEKSATFDEPNKLISGYANIMWRDYRLAPDHPPLARIINAIPLLALNIPGPRIQNRLWEDSLVSDNAQRLFTQAMLYRVDADWILFWGRIPVIGLGVILGLFVFFWARELYGTAPAIVALFLYGLDPNILAHPRLATSDLTLTLFTLVALWYLISSQGLYPHNLAYFNELTGGADRGYKVLVDSNLDWGKDLKGLKKWMLKNHVDLIGLSYFGTADPRYYKIPFIYLPSIPFYYPGHEERDGGRKPSFFAISATNLQGVFLNEFDRKALAPFLKKEPIAKVGYSIFIYR